MSAPHEQVRRAVEEAVRLGLSAFEDSVIAQLAGITVPEASGGLLYLHFEDKSQLAIECPVACPQRDCATQFDFGYIPAAGKEQTCPFCSSRIVVRPEDAHYLYVPCGELAQARPRDVVFRPQPRLRLSPLANPGLGSLNPSIGRLTASPAAGMMQ